MNRSSSRSRARASYSQQWSHPERRRGVSARGRGIVHVGGDSACGRGTVHVGGAQSMQTDRHIKPQHEGLDKVCSFLH